MSEDPARDLADEVRAMLDTHACFQAEPPLIGVIELRRRLATLDAARTPALDVERLVRAMRWAGIRCEPEYATVEDAARQLAGDYASSMLDALAAPPEPGS